MRNQLLRKCIDFTKQQTTYRANYCERHDRTSFNTSTMPALPEDKRIVLTLADN